MTTSAAGPVQTGIGGWRAAPVWLVVVADLVWTALTAVLIPEQPSVPRPFLLLIGVMVASFGIVGALVVTRRRRNPVGWILWGMASMVTVSLVPTAYVTFSMTAHAGGLPGTVALAWLSNLGILPALWIVVVFVPLLFPDGRLPSPRWRWLAAFDVAATLLLLLPAMFRPGPLAGFDGTLGAPLILNPLGVDGAGVLATISGVLTAPMVLTALPLTVAASVVRFHRGSATERQQLRWFGAAVAFTATTLVLSIPGTPLSEVGWLLTVLSFSLIPVAIGIAVLRYRLYEIDLIINRALVYVPLTAIVAGIYAATVALSGRLLAAAGLSSDGAIVLTTLVVVVVFTPIKNAVQGTVDRRFKVGPRAPEPPVPAATELTALLRELAALRDAGVLTMAEFDVKKAEVLARL